MADCDGFFKSEGIPFEPSFQDVAVRAVKIQSDLTINDKKRLIQCWFDTTYGHSSGSHYDLRDSRAQMASYIRQTPYATFELLLAS